MEKYNKKISMLNFNNVSIWSEKDISQFLIWDFLNALETYGFNDLPHHILKCFQTSTQKYNRYKFGLDLLDKFISKIYINNNIKNKKILFQGISYPSIFWETKKYYSPYLIVSGEKERLFALKNFIGYVGINNLYQYVYKYLIERNIKYLYELIKRVEEKLKVIKPDYIVLLNDGFPIERAIILVSKKLNITTINIQDAIYQSNNPVIFGKAADYTLVWGKYFKDLYVNQRIKKPEEIYILGYPFLIEKSRVNNKKNKDYTVCYLGENYEQYNKELLNIKLETISEINEICNTLGMRFIYRPHPGENIKMLKSKVQKICFTHKNEKLTETIRKGDIFISFDSTSLVEAAMRSKICLQLMNYSVDTDNFEKLGVCTKSFQKIEELEKYLENLIKSSNFIDELKPKFNNYYIETSYRPEKRFLEILQDIDKKTV